jgi:hypothetical protein
MGPVPSTAIEAYRVEVSGAMRQMRDSANYQFPFARRANHPGLSDLIPLCAVAGKSAQ